LPRHAAIGERALQPLIDKAFVGRVLIDDDERIVRLGDDERILDLRAGGPERV